MKTNQLHKIATLMFLLAIPFLGNAGDIKTKACTLSTWIIINSNISCNGNSDGIATAEIAGGTSPFTYSWSNGETTSTATGLSSANYTVTVTDATDCISTAASYIGQPTVLTVTINDQSCPGSGTLNANASGGSPMYSYLWSDPANQTNLVATGLSTGSYTVTITDINGCTATASISITIPAILSPNITVANISCNGANNGSASSNPTGGTSPYNYNWSIANTNSSISSLAIGTYTLNIWDSHGCTATASITITQPPVLTAWMISNTNVTCFGGNNGTATANCGGGTSPYTYSWNNGETNLMATGLSAAGYTLTVTDNNGCTATTFININQPASPVNLWFSWINNPTCLSGDSNGVATLSASNGVGTYTYSWSNGRITTNNTITDLSTGSYTVTVFDGNGCTATTQTFLDTLNVNINSINNVNCYGQSTGNVNVVANNGQAPYTFSWSNSALTSFDNGLNAGSYTVTVWDFHGCIVTASVIITQPPVLTASIAATNVSCNGGSNGSATLTASGGTSPYTYSWSPVYGTNATVSNLVTNVYTVNVRDANGCNATASVFIWQPAMLGGWIAGSNVLCYGGNSGSATANPTNGTSPYTYSWNPGGQTTATATGLTIGNYTVTIKDSCNASFTSAVYISQPDIALNVTADEYTGVTCYGGSNGAVIASSGGGTPSYTFLWSPGGNTNGIASGLATGNYTVTETDHNGCTATASVALTGNSPVLANITSHHDVSCHADSDGYLFGLGSGGLGGYHNLWSNGGINTLDPNLKAGTYSLQVTDAGGCVGTNTATITQPTALYVTPYTYLSSAIAYVSGGSSPYTYSWAPSGGTKFYASGLSNGLYTVTVTDAHSCAHSHLFRIGTNISPDTNLYVTIANPSISCGTYEFDIMVSSNAHTYFDNFTAYIAYSNGAFGDSIVKNGNVTITKGANFNDTTYESPNINNSKNDYGLDTMAIDFRLDPLAHTLNRTLITDSAQQLLHIKMNILNCDSALRIYFTDTALTQIYSFGTRHANDSSNAYFFYDSTTYTGRFNQLVACGPAINPIPYPINAGTNAVSVPANSSILTLTGTGFGNTIGWINVPDANSGGSRKFNLDTTDILSWADNKIVIKMPSKMIHDPGTPGTGYLTLHSNCGYSDSTYLSIKYNIENFLYPPTNEKTNYHIEMSAPAHSLVFRCDTSISHNPQAYACVKKAIREWNCWTGVNWICGNDIMLDTTQADGISNIYFSNWNFTPAAGLMATNQQRLSCYDLTDSLWFYDEADIQIKRGGFLPGGKLGWSYDTTGTQTSALYDYFYDRILHEIGHAHGLGHIIDSNSLMNYLFGVSHRYDSIIVGTFAAFEGGMDEVNSSSTFKAYCADSNLRPDTTSAKCFHRDCHCPSGIANIFQNSCTVNLYPNPAGETLNIEYQLTGNAYICFKITDCLGRVVMNINNEHKNTGYYREEQNISRLSQGVYFFIANINGEYKTIKFIKI